MRDEPAECAEGARFARTAAAADRDDAESLALAGYGLLFLDAESGDALLLLDRAVSRNPNSASVNWCSAVGQLLAGDHDAAIRYSEQAMRLNPRDPWMFTIYGPIGLAHLLERRFDEALIWLRRALHEQPGGPHLLAGLVCTYSYLGCMKDARAMLQRLVEVGPQTLIE